MALQLAQDPVADRVLDSEPFALLVGMLLDQQVPMERAFGGAARLHDRMADRGGLTPQAVVGAGPDELVRLCSTPPAVHRFPAAMGKRVHALAVAVRDAYGADTTAIWRQASDGADVRGRLQALPGFGAQKAQIFTALLGKQLGVHPPGWREAAGPYGERGSSLSVADVVDADSLAAVRATKAERKRLARAAARR